MVYIELSQKHKTSTERGDFYYSFDGSLEQAKSAVLRWLDSNGYREEDTFDLKTGCLIRAEHSDGMVWAVGISESFPEGIATAPFETVGGC